MKLERGGDGDSALKARAAGAMRWALRPILRPVARALFRLIPEGVEPRMRSAVLANLIPPGRTFVFTRYLGGLSVLVDHGIFLETQVTHGGYESYIVREIQRLLPCGGRCVDVGANVGLLTLAMADVVGPSGRVLAVEPGERLCQRMRRNIGLNPKLADRIHIVTSGLSDAAQIMYWIECDDNPGNATLEETAPERAAYSPVSVMTLDAVLDEAEWREVDLVKIDVEGMELQVLRGATGLLRRCHPLLVFETLQGFRFRDRMDRFKVIGRLLGGLGYRFATLSPEAKFARCDPDGWCHMTWAYRPEHAAKMGL